MRTRPNLIQRLIIACLAVPFIGAAFALEPAEIRVEQINGGPRILVVYDAGTGDQRPNATAEFQSSVVIIRFDTPIEADVSELAEALGSDVALARLDPDGGALRIAMRRGVEPHVSASYNHLAIDLTRPGQNAPPPVMSPREVAEREAAARAAELAARPPEPADPLPVQWRMGQASEYTRLEFIWPRAVGYQLSQDGQRAVLRFDAPARIDLTRLEGSPPRLMRAVSSRRDGDAHEISFNLDPGVEARAWAEDERIVLDLLDPAVGDPLSALQALVPPEAVEPPAPAEPEITAETAYQPDISGPDPVPASGVVRATIFEGNGELQIGFPWEASPGAAVFRRGEAIWIVFDAEADLDLDQLALARRGALGGYETLRGEGYSAARIVVGPAMQAAVREDGDRWVVALSERIDAPPRPVGVRREARHGEAGRIVLDVEGARRILWVDDPAVGDRIGVVAANAPVQGLGARRDYFGVVLLPSAHGAAVETLADDLRLTLRQGGAVIERTGQGLALTPAGTEAMALSIDPTVRTSSPGFMDFDAWKGEGRYRDVWPALLRRAALDEGTDGRLALARYALANGLAPEALGMLAEAIAIQPNLVDDAHVRALQGVASLQMGRFEDAADYFAQPELLLDPAAAPWRALIAMEQERWEEARSRFEQGREVTYRFNSRLRARFRIAHARTALELGDFAAADQYLRLAAQDAPGREDEAEAEMIMARLSAASGDLDAALARLEDLTHSGYEPIEARALSEIYQLRLEAGQMEGEAGVEALESLRYRWRGDNVELQTVYALGRAYIREGAYARGLEVLRSATIRYPDSQTAREIGDEMQATFRRLFLGGDADRLDPIEAVALFYEYAELTPIGADGDRMIRRLADRLIAFDLLNPAAELLDHQVENRLREPAAKARVATELAMVYLMDRRYEEALNTIRRTRVRGLPDELVAERYLLEARALAELGRPDHALEIITNDRSPAAARLRADVAWESRDWELAGRRLEAILGDRYNDPRPLTVNEEADLLRSAIGYSLTDNRASLRRLRDRYGELMERGEQAAAFALLTDDNTTPGDVRIRDLANRIAGIDTLDAFMDAFRERFSGREAS